MIPEDPELRRALEARSGEVSPEFRARLSGSLEQGRPGAGSTQLIALVAVIVLSVASIGILLMSRGSGHVAQGPGGGTPSPTPIAMPTTLELSTPSKDVVWAYVGAVALYRSNDRGQTWEYRTLPVGQQGVWGEISFVDGQHGWYSESGSPETQCNGQDTAIWNTIDGGATWQRLATTGIGHAQCKTSLSFVDTEHGFLAAGDENRQPSIYRTSDGGRTWEGSTLPDPSGFVTQAGGFTLQAGSVRELGSTLLVPAWGMNSTTHQFDGYVFRSADGGASWHVAAKIPAPATSIAIVTASRWLQLVEPDQSSETTDSGGTWHAYQTDYSQAAPVAPQTTFGDPRIGYSTVRGSIQRTTDGGLHWVMIKTPGT
jgi:photosystem II stability/assembly factor-like uncharacterized protein